METKAHGGAQQRHSQTTNTAINHPFITFSCFINHLLLLVPCALGITRSFSIFAPTVAAVLPSTTFSLSRDHLELVHSNNNRPDRASSIILEISSDCVVETLLERSVPLTYRKRNHSLQDSKVRCVVMERQKCGSQIFCFKGANLERHQTKAVSFLLSLLPFIHTNLLSIVLQVLVQSFYDCASWIKCSWFHIPEMLGEKFRLP